MAQIINHIVWHLTLVTMMMISLQTQSSFLFNKITHSIPSKYPATPLIVQLSIIINMYHHILNQTKCNITEVAAHFLLIIVIWQAELNFSFRVPKFRRHL